MNAIQPRPRVAIRSFWLTPARALPVVADLSAELLDIGMILHGMMLMRHGSHFGIKFRRRYMVRGTSVLLDTNGRRVSDRVVVFRDESARAEFEAAVLDELRAERPELFLVLPAEEVAKPTSEAAR